MAASKTAPIKFIFITLLIDVMGLGLIIPVMPNLISQLKHVPLNEASRYGGILISTYAIVQFIFAPIIGNLSDQFGRRPILLASLLGFGIDYLILALAPTYNWLFAGRIIAGITGASFTTASAYIADISTDENRTKNFGLIGAAFGAGFVLGPVLGGLLGEINIRLPFYAASALCLLNALYGYFILPESLPLTNRRPFSIKKANPFGSMKFLATTKGIGTMAVAYFLIYFAAQAVQGNWGFYTSFIFNWSELMIGVSLATAGVLVGLVQAVLTRKINPILGNEKSVYVGLFFSALGLFLFSMATQSWMMFVFLLPYALGGIAGPAMQSIVSKNVPANQQGMLQGSFTSLMSLTTILGPLMMTNMFTYFSKPGHFLYFPGAPFLFASLLTLTSLLIVYLSLSKRTVLITKE